VRGVSSTPFNGWPSDGFELVPTLISFFYVPSNSPAMKKLTTMNFKVLLELLRMQSWT
jgi:hypothetical protein